MKRPTAPHHNGEVYLVRGEQDGVAEGPGLAGDFCSVGWNDSPDPFTHSLAELEAYGSAAQPRAWGSDAPRQIWAFAHEPKLDQAIIVMPRYGQKTVALGICASTAYRATQATGADSDPILRRNVVWLRDALPRTKFSAAAQNRFDHPLHTVSRVDPKEQASVVQELIAFVDALLSHDEHIPRTSS
jgi:predicted Mrr-cat superfamily restriction endonuclease